jgi:hypothetical protein
MTVPAMHFIWHTLCTIDPGNAEDPGDVIARWVGMYNIHNCTEAMALDHSTPAGIGESSQPTAMIGNDGR